MISRPVIDGVANLGFPAFGFPGFAVSDLTLGWVERQAFMV